MRKEKHSHIDADEEQRRYLEIEKKYAKENRALNITLTAAFFAFIYIFAVLFWILPDRDVSKDENRPLASAPKFTLEALVDGEYTSDFATYMADQFPARGFFVGLKALSERVLLKGENNGVIFGKNGYLIKRFDSVDNEILKKNITNISEFAKAEKESGVNVTIAVAGREADVAASVIPSAYGTDSSDRTWDEIAKDFAACETEFTDLRLTLREHFDAGEYVYYKTDHHWTSYGAYLAYREIADGVGIVPADIEEFRRETVSEEFYGTTWSSAGARWIEPDSMEFFRYDGDDDLVTDRGDEEFDGLYKTSWLADKDKYSAFLGGNASRIDVTSKDGGRERLLVVKDSFFHSMAPYFAKDADLIIIDLRYYTGSVSELCRKEGIDRVLVLLNVETLSDESGLGKLRMGLNTTTEIQETEK